MEATTLEAPQATGGVPASMISAQALTKRVVSPGISGPDGNLTILMMCHSTLTQRSPWLSSGRPGPVSTLLDCSPAWIHPRPGPSA